MSSSSHTKPAAYWRANKDWSSWLGRRGRVIVSTTVTVAAPEQEVLTPYSFAIVDFGDQKKEFMGAGHDALEAGDEVECVLRKMSVSSPQELIEYGIKIQKVIKVKKL